MAKFFGQIGFVLTSDIPDENGICEPREYERDYYGDVLRRYHRWDSGQQINDDINISNEISIVSDGFADQNIPYIRYVVWNGTKWKVSSVEIDYPRLKLSIGGVYNGEQTRSAEDLGSYPWR